MFGFILPCAVFAVWEVGLEVGREDSPHLLLGLELRGLLVEVDSHQALVVELCACRS